MTVPSSEIGERHLVSAANLCFQVMDLARESIRRKPFCQCVCIEVRSVNSLSRRLDHPMKSDRICVACCHYLSSDQTAQRVGVLCALCGSVVVSSIWKTNHRHREHKGCR